MFTILKTDAPYVRRQRAPYHFLKRAFHARLQSIPFQSHSSTMTPHTDTNRNTVSPPSPSGGGGLGVLFLLALIITGALAWYLKPAAGPTPVAPPDAGQPGYETVTYTYINSSDQMTRVDLEVAPKSDADREIMDRNLRNCWVFYDSIIRVSKTDWELLQTVKAYTNKENLITDQGLAPRAGMVSQVRVLLEQTFQTLRTAAQFRLLLKNPPTKIAQGQEFSIQLGTEGVDPKEIQAIDASVGRATSSPDRKVWTWTGVLSTPGPVQIRITGRDRRGLGKKSQYDTTITVIVTPPIPRKCPPRGAFVGETFNLDLVVTGLDDAASYSYTMTLDGQQIKAEAASAVSYKIPDDALDKTLEIVAHYKGRPYAMVSDTCKNTNQNDSRFSYRIGAPADQIATAIVKDREYSIGQLFEFTGYRCGVCSQVNMRPVPVSHVGATIDCSSANLEVEVEDRVEAINTATGQPMRTVVRFRITGKLPKDGAEATLHLRAGQARKDIQIYLVP